MGRDTSESRPTLKPWGVAAGATLASSLLRWGFSGPLGEHGPFLAFVPAVAVAAWYGGLGPGLLATGLSALLGWYPFVPLAFPPFAAAQGAELRLGFFLISGVTLGLMAHQLHCARARAEAQATWLADLDRRKDEFLAALSHELRNPLGAISNSVQVLQMVPSGHPALARVRQVIQRQTVHMGRLLDDLLDVARLTQGHVSLRREVTSLRVALTTALETVRPLVTERRHEVRLEIDEDPILIDGDPARLVQILTNLLHNAAKYTPEGGCLTVSCHREDTEARVVVADNGRGIEPALLPNLFDLWMRGQRTDRAEGGLGMGLWLVQQFTRLHGGTVTAESEGQGQGATFTVQLPAMPATGLPRPKVTELSAARGLAHRDVLVVEDNLDAGETLVELLQGLGHTAHLALDGPHALSWLLARPGPPDLIMLDIGLPGMSGHEVARRVRARYPGRPPFMVALSGYGQDEDRRKSRLAGCDLHVTKPLDPEELVRILGEE